MCSKDLPGQYERHRPEVTLLFRTVQNHWLDFLSEIETGGGELPAFVIDEVEAFLRCGIPAHGFIRLRCGDCGIFIHSITSDLRRRARKRKIKGKLQTGSLTVGPPLGWQR